MALDLSVRTGAEYAGVVARHYGSFITSGETFHGVWKEEQGIAFLDREWSKSLRWEAPRRELEGMYNFYIQSKPHLQRGEFNGLGSRAWCRAGTVQFVKPDETVHTAGSGETRILQVSFSPAYLTSYLGRNFIVPAGVDLETRQLEDIGLSRLALAHHHGIQFGVCRRQLYFDQLREATLGRILSLYSTHGSRLKERAESLAPSKTRTLLDFIEANLAQDLRLNDLAKVVGLSRAHFARSFHKVLGMSPHRYVQHRRLNHAMDLLRSRAYPIKEIAALSGFADAAHLTRSFKLKFGTVPSQCQRELKSLLQAAESSVNRV